MLVPRPRPLLHLIAATACPRLRLCGAAFHSLSLCVTLGSTAPLSFQTAKVVTDGSEKLVRLCTVVENIFLHSQKSSVGGCRALSRPVGNQCDRPMRAMRQCCLPRAAHVARGAGPLHGARF